MPTVYDVEPNKLIERVSRYLMENVPEVSPPPWAAYVKTGVHKERPPDREDWWYVRCASLLRKLYVHGPKGVSRLRREYGGRCSKGMRPEHARPGSGSILRKALQQLEKAGLVKTVKGRGRMITDKGKSLLDSIAAEIKREEAKASGVKAS
ncbi:MAG: 30S ribosomal protein S19e [Candidatus Hecatellaceae archaeon]